MLVSETQCVYFNAPRLGKSNSLSLQRNLSFKLWKIEEFGGEHLKILYTYSQNILIRNIFVGRVAWNRELNNFQIHEHAKFFLSQKYVGYRIKLLLRHPNF